MINFPLSEDGTTQSADGTVQCTGQSTENSLQIRAEQPSGISPSTDSHPYRDSESSVIS